MKQLSKIARLTDAEAARLARPGTVAHLAAEVTTHAYGEAPAAAERSGRVPDELAPAGGRGPRRYRRGLVLAGAGALAIAAGAAVALAPGGAARPGGQAGSQPAVRAGNGSTGHPAPGPATSAAQLVAYATRAAAGASAFSPQPHQWMYFRTVRAASSAGEAWNGTLLGPPDERRTAENWTQVSHRRSAHRSPSEHHGQLQFAQTMGQPGGWSSDSYAYLNSLPSGPARLKAVIESALKSQNYLTGRGPAGVFNAIQNLMENDLLPPRLNAGLYAVLVSLPGIHFDRSFTDLAGQHVIGLYRIEEGYLKDEFMIDPKTYAYRGDRYEAVRAHTAVALDGQQRYRKGQILNEEAVVASGIVDHAGQTRP